MGFGVGILLPVLDIAYTVSNIQVCSAFPAHSQALAGSIFSVSTRVRPNMNLTHIHAIAQTLVGLAGNIYWVGDHIHRRQHHIRKVQQETSRTFRRRSSGSARWFPSSWLGVLWRPWAQCSHYSRRLARSRSCWAVKYRRLSREAWEHQ